MATQGLQNTRVQYPESVHNEENACETEYEEVYSGVPSDAVKFFIPSVTVQSSVLTADAPFQPMSAPTSPEYIPRVLHQRRM